MHSRVVAGIACRARRGVSRPMVGWLSLVALIVVAMSSGGFANPTEEDWASPGELRFVGKNLIATAHGVFHRWRVIENRIDPSQLEASEVLVEVDLASVDTGSQRRDDHLRNPDFFEVERWPTALARVHSPQSAGTSEAGHPLFSVKVDLDLHGVQKTLEGEIEWLSRQPLAFEGRVMIDRMDFGIGSPPSRWNPMSVRAAIPVSFRIDL